jgi:hypothetical protein
MPRIELQLTIPVTRLTIAGQFAAHRNVGGDVEPDATGRDHAAVRAHPSRRDTADGKSIAGNSQTVSEIF